MVSHVVLTTQEGHELLIAKLAVVGLEDIALLLRELLGVNSTLGHGSQVQDVVQLRRHRDVAENHAAQLVGVLVVLQEKQGRLESGGDLAVTPDGQPPSGML